MNAQARPVAAIGGRRLGTEEGRRNGAGLILETEMTEEAGEVETGRLTVAGGLAEKEIGANERLGPREQT